MSWKFIKLGGETSSTTGKQQTSDVLAKNAKQFLEEIDIRAEVCRKPTLQILNTLSQFKLPERNRQFRIRTQTQINLISLILAIVKRHGVIDELTISTYTLNKEAFDILKQLLQKGKILKLNLVLASSYSFRDKDYFNFLQSECLRLSGEYSISLIFAWLHFKISLAKCGKDFYQFEGSMNYSTNNMAEQILFCNSREVYEYDYNFIMSLKAKTNNKALEIIC